MFIVMNAPDTAEISQGRWRKPTRNMRGRT